MRKSIIIGGALAVGLALVGVVYVNSGRRSPEPEPSTPSQVETAQKPSEPAKKPATPAKKPKSASPNESQTQPPVTAKDRKVDEFLVHSHVKAQVDLLAEFFGTGLNSLDPKERKVLEPLFEKALQSGLAAYRKAILERFNEKELDELDAIYRDPQFSAFNEDAIKAAGVQESAKLTKHILEFNANKLPKDRHDALAEIADAELKVGFPDFENEGDVEASRFKQRLKESFLGRLDALTEGKSVDEIRHIASKMNDPLVIAQKKLQMQVFEDSMKPIEDAALESVIEP